MRKHFEIGVQKAGGKIRKIPIQERPVLRLCTETAKALANHWQKNAQSVRQAERRIADAQEKAVQKQLEQIRRSNIAADRSLTLAYNPGQNDTGLDIPD